MNRFLVILAVCVVAAVVLLPVIISAGYFVPKLWTSPPPPEASPATGPEPTRIVVPRPQNSPPPPVEGLVLRPEQPKGEIVTGPLVDVSGGNRYIVRPGDTLFDIVLAHYGDSTYMQDVQLANPRMNPNVIRPGQEIILPPRRGEERGEPTEDRPKYYVVQHGETLISIARRLYGDAAMYVKIYELNRSKLSSPDRVPEGTVLTLPPPPKYD